MTKLWGYIIGVAALALAIWSFYTWSFNRGEDRGYTKGYEYQQTRIEKLQEDHNLKIDSLNEKIQRLEGDAVEAATRIVQLEAKNKEKSTTIITKYVERNPETSVQCGWDESAVESINELLKVRIPERN